MHGLRGRVAELWQSFGASEVVDILVVSVFIYSLISWFRSARTRSVALGVAALTAVYGLAQLLELYLTLWIFNIGLTVALVALVIIFQDDIRRAFEKLATSRMGTSTVADETLTDVLVRTAETLAKERSGALIVLPGRDPIERHLTGGTRLAGLISEALLLSIFDHNTPGHDGAVVIENERVRSFGVHLPLSTAIKGGERFGTRHTAALGLSEQCDALVIVVSEERGVVSLAQNGELKQTQSTSELADAIRANLRQGETQSQSAWRRLVFADLPTKLAAVLLALVSWVLVFGFQGETLARTFGVPIEYRDVPEGWQVDEPDPLEARVTLSGTTRAFRMLDPKTLVVSLDVGQLRSGRQKIYINEDDFSHPSDLVVNQLEPSSIVLTAYETQLQSVSVKPATQGKLPAGKRLAALSVEPKTVALWVRKRDAQGIREIKSEPIDLRAIKSSQSLKVGVRLPPNCRLSNDSAKHVVVNVVLSDVP